MSVHFGSLSRLDIKPNETGYFVGPVNQIRPGAVLRVIRSVDSEVVITSRDSEKPSGIEKEALVGDNIKEMANLDPYASEQQRFVVDEYRVGDDGKSATLYNQGVYDTLGFDLGSSRNDALVSLKLLDEKRLQVQDASIHPADYPVINLIG